VSRQTNVRALRKLDKFFEDNPDVNLIMESFASQRFCGRWIDDMSDTHVVDVHDCNSAACAVGWGPAAGLVKHLDADNWSVYSNLTFFNQGAFRLDPPDEDAQVLDPCQALVPDAPTSWDFMFSGAWGNSIELLRERLQFVIEFDAAPRGWDIETQSHFRPARARELMQRHREGPVHPNDKVPS